MNPGAARPAGPPTPRPASATEAANGRFRVGFSTAETPEPFTPSVTPRRCWAGP